MDRRRRRDRGRRVRSHANIQMNRRVTNGYASSAEVTKIVNARCEEVLREEGAFGSKAIVAYRYNIGIDPYDYAKEQADYGDLVVVIYHGDVRSTVMRRYSTNSMRPKALKVQKVIWKCKK